MKAISLEGFRRFVRGNRDKDDESQTFKRSHSFKRATLRKSSRRQDLITLPNGLVVKTSAVSRKESVSSDERPDDGYSTDEDTGAGSSISRRVISYDEWVADDNELRNGPTDESCISTLSTNKLSSLDSGVRHSLDSQKCHRIESHRPTFQRVHVRNPLSEGPLSLREEDFPVKELNSKKTLDSNFRHCNGSPVTPSKLKSLLGSPRVAPKHRDPSPCSTKTGSSINVHTPMRARLFSAGHSQPMSAPSTPGRKGLFGSANLTPTQQLRSSFHEKERFNVRHGTLPANAQLLRDKHESQTKRPKQSRWSSVFSHPFFSPMKRKQRKESELSLESFVEPPISNVNGSPVVLRQRTLFSCHGSPAVSRQLSVQSAHASPDSRRSVTLRHSSPLVVRPGPNYGVARAIGGVYNCEEFNRRNCASPLSYSSPLNLKRQISTPNPPTSNKSSPAPVQRHQSFPQRSSGSPALRRPLPPIPSSTLIQKSSQTYTKPLQALPETPMVVNSSQFYPGKVGCGMVSALPSITIVGGSTKEAPRPPTRQSIPDWSVQMNETISDRPKTPRLSKISMTNFRRPLSLAFNCARKNDLMSPASITSESSSRGGRRKQPSVVVSRVSWFARSSVRKSTRFNRLKKRCKRRTSVDGEIPPPPVPVRSTSHNFSSTGLCGSFDGISFVPPERRRHSTLKSEVMTDDSTSTSRTAHVNLLMPLNQPVGSCQPTRTPKTSQRIRNLIAEGQRLLKEDVRDTTSEPGGLKFRVHHTVKPTSAPNTTRLNVRVLKNPEAFLKTFGLSKKTWKRTAKSEKLASSKDKLAGEIILKQVFQQNKQRPDTPISEQPTSSMGSEESLVSLVDSFDGNSEFRHSRRLRRINRKRSQRRKPVLSKQLRKSSTQNTGDITQKGYEKKRGRLLGPYTTKEQSQASEQPSGHVHSRGANSRGRRSEHRNITNHEQRYLSGETKKPGSASPSTRSRRRAHRRVTRNESRYHSEVRQEAVKEALAQFQARPKNLPLPSKRSSVMTARSPDRLRNDSDSEDSDDDSINAGGSLGSSGGHSGSHGTPEVNRAPVLLPPPSIQQSALPPVPGHSSNLQPTTTGSNSSASTGSSHHHNPQPLPPKQQQPLPPIPPHRMSNGNEEDRRRREALDMSDLMRNISYSQPPDVTHHTNANQRPGVRDDRINRYPSTHNQSSSIRGQTQTDADAWRDALYTFPDSWRGTGRWKVSSKIQQLLNTLKRPKRRPLPDFYIDDEEDLEIAAKPKDPNAPKPEGKIMSPARGQQLVIPAGLPRSVEDAVYRYGSSSGFKAPAATVLDANGKLSVSLTYGKLLSRSHKMAYNLLSRLSGRGEGSVMAGDRVALVYPNNDPISFMCAFYACLQSGLVPVPIEVPLSRRDAGSQQIGFLLGSCGVSVALTSEACFKGLPKNTSGEVAVFKGWPKLNWFITDHLPKPPKDWLPPPKVSEDTSAYIEYSTDKDGSVKGVVVPKSALLAQCRTLTSACNYTEGEVAVCVLDFKREVGLWHAILCSVFNGMHVIFIPYSVMKVNPASWMHMITRFKASIAIVKSRDLHWGLLATKDHKDVNLQSLRLLLVADGANPWSLSSCDQFLAVFQSKGLRPDAICPCASSPEALTVSVRRPGHGGASAVGRGVLSMQGLSYGVVRVDQENSLTSLTLQDCGQVLPGAQIVVIKLDGAPYLCQTDEVGEICVSGPASGSQYWGLKGLTNSMFRVQPLLPDGTFVTETITYVRSGLLGFLGPGGLVFVCGSRDGLMTVTGRKHNTDDIIATVLAVEPMKFIYRGRIGVFSHKVLRDERICIVAEQRPDCSEEESFQWMSRVLQAVDSIHQVGIYCLTLVPPNHLPKTPLGGIHLSETRKKFLEGSLHPANVLMCPHTCVTNLPKPREVHHDVGPASVMVGNLVQGNRLAMAQGRDLGLIDEEDMRRHPQFIAEILKWRASTTENHEILVLMNNKGQVATSMTCAQLHKKAERVAFLLMEKGHVNTGDHVALIYPPGIDLIVAFYGCLYVGAVPVTIRPPHPQNLQSTVNTVRTVVDVSKSSIILSTQSVIKLLKNKEEKLDSNKKWPTMLDTDELPKKKIPGIYKVPTPEMIAYLDFSVSTTGMLAGIKMSHAGATALCLSMKVACELYPSRVVALCLDPYCGLGLALWVLSSVYSGHQSILIPPSEVETNPALWLSVVSQYKVRDTFCSYGVMELCTKGLGSSIPTLKQRGVNLGCVRTCVVIAEERPRMQLTTSFSKLFNGLGLSPRAVSTSFGCRVNVAICLQGASSPDPSTVYVDLRSLRHDRVTLVERGAPHSLCIMESGKLLPGTKVVIANPDTKGHCSDSHLGEIWVQCNHNASGYFTVYGDDGNSSDHFNSQLVTGNTGEVYARTGYLGFLRRTEAVQADGELHDAVFVVGALDETIILRGMRYHPIDIETTVMRCHKKVAECAVFTWTNLLVVVVELDGQEYEALDLVPLVTSSVLEEHQVIIGVIVVVDPGVVPINSRGEKQRMHLRDGFLADQLDPIYVAYNM